MLACCSHNGARIRQLSGTACNALICVFLFVPCTLMSAPSSKVLGSNWWYTPHWGGGSQEKDGHLGWWPLSSRIAQSCYHQRRWKFCHLWWWFFVCWGTIFTNGSTKLLILASKWQNKLCPRATTLPKQWGCGIIIANLILPGSILMKKLLDKIG